MRIGFSTLGPAETRAFRERHEPQSGPEVQIPSAPPTRHCEPLLSTCRRENGAHPAQIAEAIAIWRPRWARDPELSPAARERIHALVSDLPRVWNDPCTPARERKRILRLLIEDVTLVRDRQIHLHIRWKGGATTSLDHPLPLSAPDLRRTSATVVEMVRALCHREDRSSDRRDSQRSLVTNGDR